MKRFEIVLCLMLMQAVSIKAQLALDVSEPKIIGRKAIVPLSLRNGLSKDIESARAIMFLIDGEGKVVGRATGWIIGGDKNHPPLAVGRTNVFNFVVPTDGKPFVTNRLTVTQIKLANGKTANPVTDVRVRWATSP